MQILVFAGSTRNDSFHRKLALYAAEELRRSGAEATYVELKDYPMPLYDGDLEVSAGLPESARAFKQLLREHDGVVIASPEYNGSFPALIKNLVDWVTRPEPGEAHSAAFRGKTVALLSTSPGPGGGKRGLRHLHELFEMIGAKVVDEVAISKAFDAFSADGILTRPADVERVGQLASAVAA